MRENTVGNGEARLMHEKLNEKELIRLVEVVSQLDEERKQSLDKAQLAQILRDLNMSDDLLDEAMIRLQQNKITARHKRKTTAIVVGAIVAVVLAIGTLEFATVNFQKQLAPITASETRITSMTQPGQDLSSVASGADIVAVVTLQKVPSGIRLPMRAQWIDPNGTVYHENVWETKTTNKQTWETHAKAAISTGAPKGEWSVKFFVGEHVVATRKFAVN